MIDLLQHEKINPLLLDRLQEEEKHLLHEVCCVCDALPMIAGYGIKGKKDDEYERFRLLQGSVVAGDNSPQVLKELKTLILKFMSQGKINKREGYGILAEIAILS